MSDKNDDRLAFDEISESDLGTVFSDDLDFARHVQIPQARQRIRIERFCFRQLPRLFLLSRLFTLASDSSLLRLRLLKDGPSFGMSA